MNKKYRTGSDMSVICDNEGKISRECLGCLFFYGEKSFKPIYNDETLLASGKDPARFKTGLYCENCQDKKGKSGVWNL
jgi:hypothetical protein